MTTQLTEIRKSGISIIKADRNFIPDVNVSPVKVNDISLPTAAQAITIIGYGDTNDLQVRSLNYQVKCDNYQDFKKCLEIISQYNDFDASRIIKHTEHIFSICRFWNDNNPNNGNNLFTFYIARENSPAIYVEFNNYLNPKIITHISDDVIYWSEFLNEDFEQHMKDISQHIDCDKFSLNHAEYPQMIITTARFWWD